MLEIKNLKVSVEGKQILKGLNLKVIKEKYMLLWALTVPVKAHWLL